MANEDHLKILLQGVEAWNAWRKETPDMDIRPDLGEAALSEADLRRANLGLANLGLADLRRADLSRGNLIGADLREAILNRAILIGADLGLADLRRADLIRANLSEADLREADLSRAVLIGADLRRADLSGADLIRADLKEADLSRAILIGADLRRADLSRANLYETIFADLDLSSCKGLESCRHSGPCTIDPRTLQRSGPLPLAFLRGVGLPDNLIEYLPALLNQPIQFYSCFISYSSKDQAFVERLHADLQAKGVRCWFAPHDMPTGAKILDAIDEAIRLRDKVLLVLSKRAIASDWVEGEVTRGLAEERKRKKLVLFPIRIDNAVFRTEEAWARLLQEQRNIGDFTHWKEHDAYSRGLDRLLRDLKVAANIPPS